jgi:hypothetical protein
MLKACLAAVSALLAAGSAGAAVLVPADLTELSREAGAIVRGRVAAVEGRWTPDRRGVETLVTLEAEAYLKGALGETVTFTVPGGRLGRFRNLVVGAPELAVDQRIIVFLGHRGPGIPFVLGLSQGVYRLVRTGDSWFVAPTAPTTAGPLPQKVVRGDPARRPLALPAFERQVRLIVERAR